MLRERLQALEAELENRKLLAAGAVENHQGTAEQQLARQSGLAAFTQRVLSELSRDRTPVSRISPEVLKYLKTYDQLKAEGQV